MDDESDILGGDHGENIHVDDSEAALLLLSDDEEGGNERQAAAEDDDTLVVGLNQADLFEDSFREEENANFTHLKTRPQIVQPTSLFNSGIASRRSFPHTSSSRSSAIGLEAALSNRSTHRYSLSASPFPSLTGRHGLVSGGRNRQPGGVPHRRERTNLPMENPFEPEGRSEASGRHSLPVRSVPQQAFSHLRSQPFCSRPRLSAGNMRIAETEQRIAVDPLAPPRKDLKPYQPFHENEDDDEIAIVSEHINSHSVQWETKSESDHDAIGNHASRQENNFTRETAIKGERHHDAYEYDHVTEDEVMVLEDSKVECVDVSDDETSDELKPVGFFEDFGKVRTDTTGRSVNDRFFEQSSLRISEICNRQPLVPSEPFRGSISQPRFQKAMEKLRKGELRRKASQQNVLTLNWSPTCDLSQERLEGICQAYGRIRGVEFDSDAKKATVHFCDEAGMMRAWHQLNRREEGQGIVFAKYRVIS